MILTLLRAKAASLGILLVLGGVAVGIVVGTEALGQSITGTSDVRIVAQKVEDGRIEFGLEQDGERILPRSRFFPTDAQVGRWLRSSPLKVAAAQGAEALAAKPSDALIARHSFTCLDRPTVDGSVYTESGSHNDQGNVGTMLFNAGAVSGGAEYRSGYPLAQSQARSLVNWFLQCSLFHGDPTFGGVADAFNEADSWQAEGYGTTPTSSSGSITGTGDAYRSAGHFNAGNYVCSITVSGNTDSYGGDNFAVVSYGADGSYGTLHANEIASSYSGSSRLAVGSGWSADVPVGEVYFEVTAAPSGRWSISCR